MSFYKWGTRSSGEMGKEMVPPGGMSLRIGWRDLSFISFVLPIYYVLSCFPLSHSEALKALIPWFIFFDSVGSFIVDTTVP